MTLIKGWGFLLLSFFSGICYAQSLYSQEKLAYLQDQDKDGVINVRDQCIDTPKGYKVDNHGCPKIVNQHISSELDIHFPTGEYKLRPSFYVALVDLGKFLQRHPDTLVIIEGHTDDVGSRHDNLILSRKRAETIATALIEKFKIDKSRVKSLGYGEQRPAVSNLSQDGRLHNRRVLAEIVETYKATQEVPTLKWSIWDYKNPGDIYSDARYVYSERKEKLVWGK